MRKSGLIAAIAILLGANAVTLILARQNRSGGATQTIELTERELALQSLGQDNSGVALQLRWHRQDEAAYFGRAQLEAIGFNFRLPSGRTGKDILLLPRRAFVALEYEGKAWQDWLPRPDNQQEPYRANPLPRTAATRLFPVDVSKNLSELRSRYPDQRKYLIVSATVEARIRDIKDHKTGVVLPDQWVGNVMAILPSEFNVPLPFTRLLAPLNPEPNPEPRYAVTLAYGRNLEPWITSVVMR